MLDERGKKSSLPGHLVLWKDVLRRVRAVRYSRGLGTGVRETTTIFVPGHDRAWPSRVRIVMPGLIRDPLLVGWFLA